MDLTKGLEFLKLSPKHLLAVAGGSSLLLFLPPPVLSRVGLSGLVTDYRPWLGGALFVSGALLAVHGGSWLWDEVTFRLGGQAALRAGHARLAKLTPPEKALLRIYIHGRTRSANFRMESGVVNGLRHAKVIYLASNLGSMFEGFAYNIQDWAWDHLNANPHLLDD